jgi:hypothetical protein
VKEEGVEHDGVWHSPHIVGDGQIGHKEDIAIMRRVGRVCRG